MLQQSNLTQTKLEMSSTGRLISRTGEYKIFGSRSWFRNPGSSSWLELILNSNQLVLGPSKKFHQNPFITCWDTLQNAYLLMVKKSWKMIQDQQKNLDCHQNPNHSQDHPPLHKISSKFVHNFLDRLFTCTWTHTRTFVLHNQWCSC